MGARHSGALSNLAFCGAVELPLFRELGLRGVKLVTYARFFDDILVVAEKSDAIFVQSAITKRSLPHFIIELEAVSQVSVPMLDMTIRKVRKSPTDDFCTLTWRPYVKATALHLPLHHDSLHCPSIHVAWPLAEVQRLYRRSSLMCDFERARDQKLARWSRFFLHPHMLEQCRRWSPACGPLQAKAEQPCTVKVVRLILPFNPALRSLRARVAELCKAWNARMARTSNFSINVVLSWRSAGTPLSIALRRLCV